MQHWIVMRETIIPCLEENSRSNLSSTSKFQKIANAPDNFTGSTPLSNNLLGRCSQAKADFFR